ncbi:ABC transporter substrate-binding protein [Heliophilum fasciatum]|uniref:ABC-type nitrate/sulfonate/bicarbonate transport system substrate-binding protein n=1 Tax=Heliophilum fasciatum TaxID=35700 RepID=A0A4V2SX63_9FIRM|nr:ABC transporter substrate-binding protein [Heliophilum fasciatum]MCW2277699.1 ABC-type nitrate/sulfonate/bicarbonate transport system substrate-binding protein [Heliophilum fasciatum]TCP65046.1 ABC-type nitrate/sulfonate/bicarbonate transport system substrate-binding protein [Heliophilum fasciatum]
MAAPNKNKLYLGMATLVALVAVVFGTDLQQHENSNSGDSGLLTVKTWTRKDCSLTPWLVTEKLGYFAEEGIRLEYTGETQAPQQIPSILNGNNDVGSFHPNTIAVAKAGGAKITGVVRGGQEPSLEFDPDLRHMNWYVNPDSGITSFDQLKNVDRKLKFSTISKNICADFLANKIADKYGLPRDKIEWVTMPDIQAVQALKQGLIDVGGIHPPYYKAMEKSGALKVADTSETQLGPAAGVTYYVFTDDFIAKNPETVKKFARAITKGQKWANDNPELARQWTEEALGVPVTGVHYYASSREIDETQIEPWIEDLEAHDVIPKGKIKPSDLVTDRFTRG